MIDFPMTEDSISTSVYCIAFYLILVAITYGQGVRRLNPWSSRKKYKERFCIFLVGFFIVTHCLHGDFFHMMWAVQDYVFRPGYYNYGEDVYIWIGALVDKNYFLFRTIVWGGAYIIYCFTARRLGLPVYYSVVLLLLSHVITFSYARATSAMAIYFIGLTFICKPIHNKPKLSIIIGALCIYASTFFHNSAIIMAAATIMIFLAIRKWSLLLVIVLIPLMASIFKGYFEQIIIMGNEEDVLIQKIQRYSQRELEHGIATIIINTFEYASFYVPVFISTIILFQKKIFKQISDGVFNIYKVTLGLMLGSFVFLFFGPSFITFYYRILFMTMIPSTLIIAKLFYDGYLNRRLLYCCIFPGLGYNLLRHMYDVYLHLL